MKLIIFMVCFFSFFICGEKKNGSLELQEFLELNALLIKNHVYEASAHLCSAYIDRFYEEGQFKSICALGFGLYSIDQIDHLEMSRASEIQYVEKIIGISFLMKPDNFEAKKARLLLNGILKGSESFVEESIQLLKEEGEDEDIVIRSLSIAHNIQNPEKMRELVLVVKDKKIEVDQSLYYKLHFLYASSFVFEKKYDIAYKEFLMLIQNVKKDNNLELYKEITGSDQFQEMKRLLSKAGYKID